MVDTDRWTSGNNNISDTIGEQLNTPSSETVCGFEYGSFGRLGASEGKANVTNVFSKSSSITKDTIEEYSSSNNNNIKSKASSQLSIDSYKGVSPFELTSFNDESSNSPAMSSPSEPEMAFVTAGSNSWEFVPCLEEVILNPESFINTMQHSTDTASPGSCTGDMEPRTDGFETCVDFNSMVVNIIDEDEYSVPLHEEIEQLSNSFYCKSNNLVSIAATPVTKAANISPSFFKILQEEPIVYTASVATLPSSETPAGQFSPKLDNAELMTHSSIANAFFSDAADDDDGEGLGEQLENGEKNKQRYDVAEDPASTPQATLQSVSSDDETPDVKTQTQLDHNYTIKMQFEDGKSHQHLATADAAKQILQAGDSPLNKLQQKRPTPLAVGPQRQTIKRQLLKRQLSNRLGIQSGKPKKTMPKLKLSIDSASKLEPQAVINTPDLTNDILDLEAEVLDSDKPFDLLTYITSGSVECDIVAVSPKEEKPTPDFSECNPTSLQLEKQETVTTLKDLFNPAKRQLPRITIEDLDELTESTNPKRARHSNASSTTSSLYGDIASETSSTTSPPKRRGRPPKPVGSIRDRSEYQHLSEADMRYREQRDKNNEASRKSRINRKDRETRLEDEAKELKHHYSQLETEERQLISECARWRKAVMRLALL